MEGGSFSEQKCQQKNQAACLLSDGDACAPLQSTETWVVTQQELRKLHTIQMKCLREILGVMLWDRRRNADIFEETCELPVEEQLGHKRLQWFGHLQRMPEKEAGSEMPTTWKEAETGRNLAALDRPRSQGPVQPSSMERACEE